MTAKHYYFKRYLYKFETVKTDVKDLRNEQWNRYKIWWFDSIY